MAITHIIRATALTLCIAAAVSSTGCRSWAALRKSWSGDDRDYLLHIHKFTAKPTDDNEFNAVQYQPGMFIYLEPQAIISSRDVKRMEVIDAPKGKSLRLTLDGHGQAVWTQLSVSNRGKQVVVMLDDEYRGWILIDKINQEGIVFVPGPFSDEEAQKIVEKGPDHRR